MSIRRVIEGGFCIGCGACSAVRSDIVIRFNPYGDLVAVLPTGVGDADLEAAGAVCPFADTLDETQIARSEFTDPAVQWHAELGGHLLTTAAYAPAHRAAGSSGGIVTWLLTSLLKRGLVDAVVHVSPSFERPDGRRFSYRLSRTDAEVSGGATSFYYPVSMDEVLALIRAQPGRYAVTGVPCFQKALRLLRAYDEILNQRIRYQVGIVCGQMKSAHYLEYLTLSARSSAVPADLRSACFRRKVPGRPANDYAFEAQFSGPPSTGDALAVETARVLNSRIGGNWGMGYFKPLACDFCDDVAAEAADIAAMDAWLPQYVEDGLGWSLVVARTPEITSLLNDASNTGDVVLDPVTPQQVADSQRGGFNHRRLGLPYRLWLRRGQWLPRRRVSASNDLSWPLRIEQCAREWLRSRSRSLWLTTGHRGDLAAFRRGMKLPERTYRWISRMKRHLK